MSVARHCPSGGVAYVAGVAMWGKSMLRPGLYGVIPAGFAPGPVRWAVVDDFGSLVVVEVAA